MTLLRRLVGAPERREAGLLDVLTSLRMGGTRAGVPVDHVTAMFNDAAFACVGLLVDVISTLPVDAFRKKAGQVEQIMAPVVDSPSVWLTRDEVVGQVVDSMAVRGNSFGLVIGRDSQGVPTQLEILDPSDVIVRREGRTGPPSYLVARREVPFEDMWHVRAPAPPGGIVGRSYVEQAREAIGIGLAAEKYSAQWFGDGAHPSSILKTDHQVNQEQALAIKERFKAAIAGREPAVLGLGMQYEPVQGDPERSQLTDTQRLAVERVARFFRIPPEMIGAATTGSSITYANREQRAIDFVTFTLAPWLVRIEQKWSALLPRGTFVRFNPGALLRADTKTRYEAHALALRSGWRSVNETRELEDQAPISDGDRYVWPPFSTSDEETNRGDEDSAA